WLWRGWSTAARTPEKVGQNALAEPLPVSEFLKSNVCYASMAFRAGLYRLFERGHIVRCYRRAWKSRDSGEVSDAKRELWLTKTQRPKRSALHSDWSRW